MLDHQAAVGHAVEERFGPIPRGVEADGPPESTGAPIQLAKKVARKGMAVLQSSCGC